jgi:hypothetical protein
MLLKPITSEQMYSIEQNGDSIFGMRRFLMMENAGHGVADFVVRKFKNLKSKMIVAVCGTAITGAMGSSHHVILQVMAPKWWLFYLEVRLI